MEYFGFVVPLGISTCIYVRPRRGLTSRQRVALVVLTCFHEMIPTIPGHGLDASGMLERRAA